MDEIGKKEEWYLNIDYREAKEIIRNKLQGMTQNFIGIGFYLRQIKETEGFRKDGYESIYEMAEDQYGIKRSTAIRWMQMNEKFSQGGYSPFLDSSYKDFGKSQLQEMLYLDSEQLEEVSPEMTVREIREIRTPDPEPEEEQLPGQMSVEDFPGVLPEQEGPAKCITGKSRSGICGAAAYCTENYKCCAECDQDCNSRCGWIDNVCDVAQDEEPVIENKNTDCPPGQTSCPRQNWGTSAEDQHQGALECAKCWNHYKKLHEHDEAEESTTIESLQDTLEENEPIIVEQPEGIAIIDAPSEPELYEELSEKTDIDIAREENQKAQMYLEMAEKEFGQNDIRVRKQKILVAALASYICELDEILNPPEALEQPELPLFRNNDQRKEWLRNYKDWGIWYTDEHIGCTYYKYDFENGARLIAEEYESQYTDYVSYLHLINGPKSPRGKYGQTKWTMYKQYNKYPNSESELVEFLKWIQKGEK